MSVVWDDSDFGLPISQKCRSKSVTFADSVPGFKISSTLLFNEQEPPAICGKDAPLLLYSRSASMDNGSESNPRYNTSLHRRHTWGGALESDSDDDLNFNFVGCNDSRRASTSLPCPSKASPTRSCLVKHEDEQGDDAPDTECSTSAAREAAVAALTRRAQGNRTTKSETTSPQSTPVQLRQTRLARALASLHSPRTSRRGSQPDLHEDKAQQSSSKHGIASLFMPEPKFLKPPGRLLRNTVVRTMWFNFDVVARSGMIIGGHESPVRLQYLAFNDEESKVTGKVSVRNLAYEKDVLVRYTLDNWKSWQEVTCSYDGPCTCVPWERDAFVFNIDLPVDMSHGAVISLAVRYRVAGQEHWDNNGGMNYMGKLAQAALSPRGERRLRELQTMDNEPGSALTGAMTRMTLGEGQKDTTHSSQPSAPWAFHAPRYQQHGFAPAFTPVRHTPNSPNDRGEESKRIDRGNDTCTDRGNDTRADQGEESKGIDRGNDTRTDRVQGHCAQGSPPLTEGPRTDMGNGDLNKKSTKAASSLVSTNQANRSTGGDMHNGGQPSPGSEGHVRNTSQSCTGSNGHVHGISDGAQKMQNRISKLFGGHHLKFMRERERQRLDAAAVAALDWSDHLAGGLGLANNTGHDRHGKGVYGAGNTKMRRHSTGDIDLRLGLGGYESISQSEKPNDTSINQSTSGASCDSSHSASEVNKNKVASPGGTSSASSSETATAGAGRLGSPRIGAGCGVSGPLTHTLQYIPRRGGCQ